MVGRMYNAPYILPGSYAGARVLSRFFAPRAGQTTARGSSSTVTARRRKNVRKNSFASKVRRLNGYKHNTQNDSVIGGTMTHNTIYTSSLTTKIAQGDDNTSRDGDSIHLTALKLKGVIHSATASNGYVYRVLVGYSGEEYNVSHSSAGLVTAEIFLPTQGGGFIATANVNPKAFTVLHDELITINSLLATTSDIREIAFNVQLDQKFDYQATAAVFGKTKNLYLIIVSGVIGGTNGTTATGSFFPNTDLIFQNMK